MNASDHNLHFATREQLLAECLRLRKLIPQIPPEPEQEEWEKAFEEHAKLNSISPEDAGEYGKCRIDFKSGWQAHERKQGER